MVLYILIAVVALLFIKGSGLISIGRQQMNANVSTTANPAAGKTGVTSNDTFNNVLGVLREGARLADDVVNAQSNPDTSGD